MKIFSPYELGSITLKNRIVMSPMTRSRAINNIPNELMAEYYSMRADGGLLITEGTAPSPNGLGYPRIPGVYNSAQIEGWRKVAAAVHAKGGKIFLQLMHTGRIAHPDNMEPGSQIVAPSPVVAMGEMFTDSHGPQPHPEPVEMSLADIEQAHEEYVQAAKNAIVAGFDGVELHGANGYLIDQFLNTASNQRTDAYGGSVEKRNRFALEVAQKVVTAIGAERTGIRLSPYGVFNDMAIFDDLEVTFEELARALGSLKLAYVHVVDHSSMGTPPVSESVKTKIQQAFGGTIIASGGLDKEKAEAILQSGAAQLVAFGRPYLANPDLVTRMRENKPLNAPNFDTFYTPGPEGYTDYPLAS